MGSLRRRLEKLEEALEADSMVVVCPECGKEFRVHADTSMDYLVRWWAQDREGETQQETSPDVGDEALHVHDPSLFVLASDRSPWLGEFFHGIGQEPQDAEDLSEP